MEKLLLKLGFKMVRQKGKHIFYRHHDGGTTTVPYQKGDNLPRPLIRRILNDINLTADQYQDELDSL
ncbi:MAG: type II toxin-antitoxin system HicA family toxin [Anaerolinea sp.]|nr:type II toxin-antitoxin system HicA family toxin [Anaerolinea sp.]